MLAVKNSCLKWNDNDNFQKIIVWWLRNFKTRNTRFCEALKAFLRCSSFKQEQDRDELIESNIVGSSLGQRLFSTQHSHIKAWIWIKTRLALVGCKIELFKKERRYSYLKRDKYCKNLTFKNVRWPQHVIFLESKNQL